MKIKMNMPCKGMNCKTDVEKGISYFEKATTRRKKSTRKHSYLYRPDSKALMI